MSALDSVQAQAVLLSLQVAVATVGVSTPLAVGLALLMARTRWRGKLLLDTLILLPMALPPALIGLALVAGLGRDGALGDWLHELTGWHLGFYPFGAVVAASLMTLPLMVRVLRPALEVADPMLLPVARSLGASPWRAWWTLTLPMAWPAVASAMALGLAAAWGEAGATLVLATALRPQDLAGSAVPLSWIEAFQHDAQGQALAWRLAWAALGVALGAVLLSEWGRRHWRQRWQLRRRAFGVLS